MNITVLAGGLSPERDVSLKSGELVAKALRNNGHRVILLDVYMGVDLEGTDSRSVFDNEKAFSINVHDIGTNVPDLEKLKRDGSFFGDNVIDICRSSDVVFMALHGADGENGKLQAAFDLFGIRYTGSDYLSSALAMDKTAAKKLFTVAGIPTPKGIHLGTDHDPESIPDFGFPCVVKPVSGGSSVGVTICNNSEEYAAGLREAFKWEDSVLVEQFIKGREMSVGVIDGRALPVIEIAPIEGFYDYKNKYTAGSAIETCPADIDEDKRDRMQRIALDVCRALGIDTYARMDFILEEGSGDIYCLEANTLPGMTPTSLVPQEAAQLGISYEELCELIIKVSLRKYEKDED